MGLVVEVSFTVGYGIGGTEQIRASSAQQIHTQNIIKKPAASVRLRLLPKIVYAYNYNI